jgi:hypothetical protein
MNRARVGAGVAILVGSAAILTLAADASPEPAATTLLPPEIAASLIAMCSTGFYRRPDPAWVRQSYQNDHCSLPPEPPALDGTKASRDQLMAGLAAAKKFLASADRYQNCISTYVTQRKQKAERTGTSMQEKLLSIEAQRIAASAASKQRVWDQIAMAVDDFNAEGSECPD